MYVKNWLKIPNRFGKKSENLRGVDSHCMSPQLWTKIDVYSRRYQIKCTFSMQLNKKKIQQELAHNQWLSVQWQSLHESGAPQKSGALGCSLVSLVLNPALGKVVALDRWGGKWNHLLMTHRLTTNCAENYCNRTLIVKVIVENVVTCFLGDTV